MTEEQIANRKAKARARAMAWRARTIEDPEAHAALKARHAAACKASRDRAKAARGPKPPKAPEILAAQEAKRRATHAAWLARPGVVERNKAMAKTWRVNNPEKMRARNQRWRDRNRKQVREYNLHRRPKHYQPIAEFAGSVLRASAASVGRDLLEQVTRLVGPHFDRDEVVAEAMMLIVEGASPSEAVARAKTAVGRFTRMQFLNVPVEDCVWL